MSPSSRPRSTRIRIAAWTGAVFLLALPLIAMQFTTEVAWSPFDFLVFGLMLGGAGLALEALTRSSTSLTYRLAAVVGVLAGFLMIWANLAVGIIGSEASPANLMYFGVIALGIVGASFARLKPRGMYHTMLAMMIGLAVAAAVAIFGRLGEPWTSPLQIVLITLFFAGMFGVSAMLFRRSDLTAQ